MDTTVRVRSVALAHVCANPGHNHICAVCCSLKQLQQPGIRKGTANGETDTRRVRRRRRCGKGHRMRQPRPVHRSSSYVHVQVVAYDRSTFNVNMGPQGQGPIIDRLRAFLTVAAVKHEGTLLDQYKLCVQSIRTYTCRYNTHCTCKLSDFKLRVPS